MKAQDKKEPANIISELISTNGAVRSAVMDCACHCTNLVAQC